MTDLPFQTLSALGASLTSGDVSSQELIDACLERIAGLDPSLHAFVDVWAGTARDAAQAADLERRAGLVRGPLHGLPIALKDLLHVRNRPTTAGSRSWVGRVADTTATVVERLLAAGMIPLGKTHMVEFAFGTWGCNAPMGAPWNPWDSTTHRVAGGSSSGSAVAVAAGLVPAAIGTDTGGSVRIPAALCGLTGLKPTYGLVSLAGVVPLAGSLDSVGPLARDVDDVALLMAVLAGADRRDPATQGVPVLDFATVAALPSATAPSSPAKLRGCRIACLTADAMPAVTTNAVRAAHDDAIRQLRTLGVVVEEIAAPFDFADLAMRNGRITAAEGWAAHRATVADPALTIDPGVRGRMLSGQAITAADYLDLLAVRREAISRFAAWMRPYAALLTPTVPITATPLAEVDEAVAPLATFTRAANYLGACALTLPAGRSAEGLPIAIQLIGAAFTDVALLRLGRAFQQVTDWHLRRPDLATLKRG